MSSSQSSFVRRYDLVIYGASGFTGNYILECFVRSEEYGKLTIAVAGRSEGKLRKTLTDIGLLTGKDLSEIPILIADSANGEQLAQMAKRAKVIVNAVGPYQLYGEPVVRAAIENGASHVDVSGEISWMESMQRKYGTLAKQQGVFCISACGWDSIPCDLGVNFLKEKFPGTLSHAEVFAQFNDGPEGSQINTGTYQTILLVLQQKGNENLEEIRKEIMPERIGITKWGPPKRFTLWWNDALKCYCLPFVGADNSVVKRSQYFDAVNNKAFPTAIQTYLCLPNAFYAIGILLWLFVVNILVKFRYTRAILEKYPSICSFGKFSENGPSRKQVEEASFEMWFFGTGWPNGTSMDQAPPTKHMTVRCDGPDAGYRTTAGCALASAITILKERERMPAESGVLSPAAAFKNTDIYGHLSSFGVNFHVVNDD